MATKINNRQRMVAALVALRCGDEAESLWAYAGDDERASLTSAYGSFLPLAAPERVTQAEQRMQTLIAGECFSGLAEVHPAWIFAALKDESPRIIGIILRYLPARHVRYVIAHLPPALRDALPDMIEAFAVPEEILHVIQRRFEKRFLPLRLSRSLEHYSFTELYYLKSEELEMLFRDLGRQEMALALSRLSVRALRLLLNRFPLKEAKRLKERMRAVERVSEALRRQAQFTVLEAAEVELGSDRLLLDIGLAAFARALTPDHQELFLFLKQKLEPQQGYILKRVMEEWCDEANQSVSEERRAMILSRVVVLAEDAIIDPAWGERFAPPHEETEIVRATA